ncbi:hypothetical protein [Frankia sp. Cj5]|uniref:hypothetical protein n=1 Tax=Frankia sp. Cj5 TaxID=2880978 RepID=UPI001EF61956|nr:hypothetical protein [Frankia sp. Cj5]
MIKKAESRNTRRLGRAKPRLIECTPGTHRYTITPDGRRHAQFLTRVHDRLLRTGLAELSDQRPDPPPLRRAADTYNAAVDQLIHHAGLAA